MDGQEALELLQDEADLPDVILLDVMMPGMSGYEVGKGERGTGEALGDRAQARTRKHTRCCPLWPGHSPIPRTFCAGLPQVAHRGPVQLHPHHHGQCQEQGREHRGGVTVGQQRLPGQAVRPPRDPRAHPVPPALPRCRRESGGPGRCVDWGCPGGGDGMSLGRLPGSS